MNAHDQALVKAAKAEAATGWEAQSKVRALAALVELGPASPLAEDELRRLLEGVASDPPDGARGAQARLAALRATERLEAVLDDEEAAKVRRLFDPSRDPDSRVAEDDWFPAPDSPGWVALFSHDTAGQRRRWYRNLVAEGLIERPESL